MTSILRSLLCALLFVAASASAMSISDLTIGTHESGPTLAQKDLSGKVVLVVFWGMQ